MYTTLCDCVLSILCTLLSSIAEKFGKFRRIFENLCEFNKDWKSLKKMSSDSESIVVVAGSIVRKISCKGRRWREAPFGNIFKKKTIQRRTARIVTMNLKLSMQIPLVYYAIWSMCIQTEVHVPEKKLNRYKIYRMYKMVRERML